MNTIKKFIHYYGPYKAVFFIDLICAAVISLVDLAYPQILRTMTKTLFTQDKDIILHALPVIAASLFVMYIVQSLCKYYVTYQGHMMGAKMERDMRRELFDHYQELSFSYYSRNNSGQMMSKLVSDLFDISEFAHHGPENLFISLVKIVGAFIFLVFINKKLALPLILLVIVMFVFSFRQNAKMQETFMENRRKIGDVNASLQDTLSGIRVVQSFANEDIERAKFKKSNEAFLVSKRDNYHCMGSFMSSNLFFQGMMYLVTLVYGGYLIAQGEMQTADLAMYALYIGIFISPIQILVELVEMMQKGLSGFRRFLDVMETESEIRDADNAAELTDVKGHVRYDHVSFHYSDDETPVLSDISIDIPAGKSIALVGPSGSGKTTICSLLPRFYDVTGGSITVDGKDIRGLTLKSLRSQIGMVQQDVYLFDGTIKDNIAYGKPGASDEEIIKAAKCASIHDFIMELPDKYDTYVGERGTRLSGGQKQRISIARVFLKNPPILILDEATSALDNESERWIQKSLEELSKNRTTITIAHRLSTIRDADEIIVIT
ncbi:MAG: ABC transporter ATP-binding protein, partial [Blautia massiliensis (ex Durand et al. 2017)]